MEKRKLVFASIIFLPSNFMFLLITVVPNIDRESTMMHSTVQFSGNKSGKSNVWANANLAKTVAALDEFKSGFPSQGLTTVSKKWWGRPGKGGREGEDGGENTEDGDVKDDEAGSEKQNSLVAIRKRIAEEGREAVELGLRQGFGSKRPDERSRSSVSDLQVFTAKGLGYY